MNADQDWQRVLANQIHHQLLAEELRRLETRTTLREGERYLPNWVSREAAQTGDVEAARRHYDRLVLRRDAIVAELGWLA